MSDSDRSAVRVGASAAASLWVAAVVGELVYALIRGDDTSVWGLLNVKFGDGRTEIAVALDVSAVLLWLGLTILFAVVTAIARGGGSGGGHGEF
ncbi:hypothetical protein [Embleya hyalina]|uniref:Uncharacterized protein n=1 Tax=Embleya hyalina TaxID=516124 RepID=A0A401YSX3_9ACTN|nr:hypothetical protein [Embleya hyalina]GCD97679.1 hypothetical protein EHYA_05375 [Embleya hyalina]